MRGLLARNYWLFASGHKRIKSKNENLSDSRGKKRATRKQRKDSHDKQNGSFWPTFGVVIEPGKLILEASLASGS